MIENVNFKRWLIWHVCCIALLRGIALLLRIVVIFYILQTCHSYMPIFVSNMIKGDELIFYMLPSIFVVLLMCQMNKIYDKNIHNHTESLLSTVDLSERGTIFLTTPLPVIQMYIFNFLNDERPSFDKVKATIAAVA